LWQTDRFPVETLMSGDRTLEGKRALILGAGARGNMGQVMARRFVEEGAQVGLQTR
jgi:NAD(P)-dependent dehydrogenase (short-subunit alcohol dehydrogenase family)